MLQEVDRRGIKYQLPYSLIKPLMDYEKYGQAPGSQFLRAVLENDLATAVCAADPECLANLRAVVHYVANELVHKCHGSKEKVRDWINWWNNHLR